MSQESLRAQIAELRKALDETTAVSPAVQKLLTKLDQEIHPLIENPEAVDHASLSARLEVMIANFETENPLLSQHLRTIVNTLSNMGI